MSNLIKLFFNSLLISLTELVLPTPLGPNNNIFKLFSRLQKRGRLQKFFYPICNLGFYSAQGQNP